MRPGRSASSSAILLILAACSAPEPAALERVERVEPVDTGPERLEAAPEPVETAHERLERALATIRPAGVAADIAFIADDELAGRDTPSSGLRVSARYLRNRVRRVGLEPGAHGGWLHLWRMHERSLDADGARLALHLGGEPLALTLGSSFAVHPTDLVHGQWRGELVWCGSGSRRDMQGIDLAGRWALCRERGESRTRRRRRAAAAGAAGVLTIASPDGDEATAERFAAWLARTARGALHPDSNSPDRIPVFWIDEQSGARLLSADRDPGLGTAIGASLEVAADVSRPIELENVCALLPGSDPRLAREVILVSAHYDHIGVRGGRIHNGADDNASGASALLALAEALAEHGPFRRSVLLLWVSGEELNLLGATAWARDPWLPEDAAAICNINLDMVGRNAPGLMEYTPTPEHARHNLLARLAVELAPREGFDELRGIDTEFTRSDHWAFARELDLPVLYLSAGEHPDYHRPTDTAEKIGNDKVARFARLVLRLIAELQVEPLTLIDPQLGASGAGR